MMRNAFSRDRERGSAMLVTLILVAALLGGAAVMVSTQLASNRSTDLVRTGLAAADCAEAGLAAARSVVTANYGQWAGSIGTGTEPSWLASAINHDLDGDGAADFTITLQDNDDELPPATNDKTRDNDLRIFVVSRCIKYDEVPREVQELLQYSGGGSCYQSQLGGCAGNGNSN
jgi:hypothetical protein